MGSTIVWWLRRFALTYMLPNENLYIELSPSFSAAFGRDSEGANWIIGFLLNKVESNLRTQMAESSLMNETLQLLMALVDCKPNTRQTKPLAKLSRDLSGVTFLVRSR